MWPVGSLVYRERTTAYSKLEATRSGSLEKRPGSVQFAACDGVALSKLICG